jgi:hypothetical protein
MRVFARKGRRPKAAPWGSFKGRSSGGNVTTWTAPKAIKRDRMNVQISQM